MIYDVAYGSVTKESPERLVGKVAELALGYRGGIGAFASMAKGYNLDLETLVGLIIGTQEELEGLYGAESLAKSYVAKNPGVMSVEAAIACDVIKRRWRELHGAIVRYWYQLEEAAMQAIRNPGTLFSCGVVAYVVHGAWLKCLMPAGRAMHYYQPRIELALTPWGDEKKMISYMGMRVEEGKTSRQWIRLQIHGGVLAENVTQGFCRDLLAAGMLRAERAGWKIVLHVHDEAGAEDGRPLADFERILSQVPSWAQGMPLEAKGWQGERYRK